MLAVPVLVYILGQSVHEATTASLVVVTAGALAGGVGHARQGRICWCHAGAFAAAALPGVIAGTVLGNAVSGSALIAAFAVIMLAIITTTSVLGLAAHLLAGRGLDVAVTATMTAACIASALVGARLAGRLPQRQLGRGFAGLVVAVGSYLLISAAFLGGPPGSS